MSDEMETPEVPIRAWAKCPPGWFPVGTHDPRDDVEFSTAVDNDGNPLWERPVQTSEHGDDTLGHYFNELSEDPELLEAYLQHRDSSPEGTDPYGPDTIEEWRGDK